MLQLAADTALRFPSVTVLKASAGSGKTYTLTARYVQFLLSRVLPKNQLKNILAITFANNASRGMRQEVLGWLKRLHARHAGSLADIGAVLGGGEEAAAQGAGALVELILSRFSEFQVKTIDSFMAMVFRASALDFGYSPEFEIVLEQDALLDYAFTLFLRRRDGRQRAGGAPGLDRPCRHRVQGERGRVPVGPEQLAARGDAGSRGAPVLGGRAPGRARTCMRACARASPRRSPPWSASRISW